MPVSRPMTQKEKADLAIKAFELDKQGKPEESEKMLMQLPLPVFLAKFAKDHIEYFGTDFFEKYGFNMAEVEAELGSDWLSR